MAAAVLPPRTFNPSAPVHINDDYRNTVIEDEPQISLRPAVSRPKLQSRTDNTSPLCDNFPTPRANAGHQHSTMLTGSSLDPSNSDSESDNSSLWSKGSLKGTFDELYDISESDSEEVPIKFSSSVKKRMGKGAPSRYPSLKIPSPGQWPTVDKLKSAPTPSLSLQACLSPSILSKLHERNMLVPSSSSTPSLDGSLTSEELAVSSCPSTPDIPQPNDSDTAWEPPVQLNLSSINLLQQIHANEPSNHHEPTIEITTEAVAEMKEILDAQPTHGRFKLNTSCAPFVDPTESEDELSVLSVPSPRVFFASLDSTMARRDWATVEPAPTTSTATEFYGVPFRSTDDSVPTSIATFYDLPWQERPGNPIEHIVTLPASSPDDEPITARKITGSPSDAIQVDEIDENYNDTLKKNATTNMDRTHLWLSSQNAYMQALCESDEDLSGFENVPDAVPKTPKQSPPALSDHSSPGKKSVRFVESPTIGSYNSSPEVKRRVSLIHDGTFWEAWRHTRRSQRARDVFRHRQARAEAEQVQRISLQRQHAKQLNGRYETAHAERPAPQRPISSFLSTAPEDEEKALVAQAERTRQALEQMQPSAWHLEAQKELYGGQLLSSPIAQSFQGRKDINILDLAGQVHCSWAWTVAMDHPKATVYTTVSSDAEAHVASLEGPSNHFVMAAPRLWELPFDDNYFDIISARNLYAHLKTVWPRGGGEGGGAAAAAARADEWDLTLRECLRVLKPGGYLEFNLLDAELVHAETTSQALSVEFAFNLKTRGYEPCPGKSFLPRLKRAGFCEIKRAWMVLPVAEVVRCWSDSGSQGNEPSAAERITTADSTVAESTPSLTGSTRDVRAMTGLVGSRMWEQWMLKLNSEMGRSEEKMFNEVAKALMEAPANASWRCLVGWAKKSLE